MKSYREQALSFVALIPPPEPDVRDRMDGQGATLSNTSTHALKEKSFQSAVEVGRLLKKVDRSLFNEWFQWANSHPKIEQLGTTTIAGTTTTVKGISFNLAVTMWDYFEPRACDVHSSISSQVGHIVPHLTRNALPPPHLIFL
jgi:hypothetical protein